MKPYIVLTRPLDRLDPQNHHDIGAIQAAFADVAETLYIPGLEIKSTELVEQHPKESAILAQLEQYSLVFCVSVAAARHLYQRLTPEQICARTIFAAVGSGTAKVLRELGAQQVVAPTEGNDSEALLARLLELGLDNFPKVLIVRAQDGRDWFKEQLQARGIVVDTVQVYQRVTHQLSTHEQHQLQLALNSPAVYWLFTSAQSALSLLPQIDFHSPAKHYFLVLHSRIAQTIQHYLQQCGVTVLAEQFRVTGWQRQNLIPLLQQALAE